MEQIQRSKLLKWVLAIAIVIVLNLFFTFAIQLGYKEPMRETFCPQRQIVESLDTKEACIAVGGQWAENGAEYYGKPRVSSLDPANPEPKGSCWPEYTCQQEYEAVMSVYNRNVFVILIVLGVLSLGAGYAVAMSSAVSLGLSLGGVLALIIASMRYWSNMDDILRVVILAIALASLIWFGIKKFKD